MTCRQGEASTECEAEPLSKVVQSSEGRLNFRQRQHEGELKAKPEVSLKVVQSNEMRLNFLYRQRRSVRKLKNLFNERCCQYVVLKVQNIVKETNQGMVCLICYNIWKKKIKGYSSVGRTLVSKTKCRGFESFCPCLEKASGIEVFFIMWYQKNTRAIQFYQREQFVIQSENIDDNTDQKEYVMIWKNERLSG